MGTVPTDSPRACTAFLDRPLAGCHRAHCGRNLLTNIRFGSRSSLVALGSFSSPAPIFLGGSDGSYSTRGFFVSGWLGDLGTAAVRCAPNDLRLRVFCCGVDQRRRLYRSWRLLHDNRLPKLVGRTSHGRCSYPRYRTASNWRSPRSPCSPVPTR